MVLLLEPFANGPEATKIACLHSIGLRQGLGQICGAVSRGISEDTDQQLNLSNVSGVETVEDVEDVEALERS